MWYTVRTKANALYQKMQFALFELAAAAAEREALPAGGMAVRVKQDGEEVTDCLDKALDMTGSVYEGPSSWCELPEKGEKARQLAHGTGKLTLADGSKYEGNFQCGRRHGHGKWSSGGDVYEGWWRDDAAFGKGRLTFATGGFYDGEWKVGRAHGYGTKVEANGYKYVGDFVDDKRHGHGKEYDASGALLREGEWSEGVPYTPPPKSTPKKKTYPYVDRVRGLFFATHAVSDSPCVRNDTD